MPEMVAILNGFGGLASTLVGCGTFLGFLAAADSLGGAEAAEAAGYASRSWEVFMSVFIGALTFTGSIVAMGKLQGSFITTKPIMFPKWANMTLIIAMFAIGAAFAVTENVYLLWLLVAISFVVGVTIVIPIGGADMPVVVSMLNSYSGWAAGMTGFLLQNSLLIVTGALVGASGIILSYVMCKAMNRSFANVLLGGFGEEGAEIQRSGDGKAAKPAAPEDAAFMMENAASMIIVPGYGMAVAQAQHAVRKLADTLEEKGVQVRFAIHPVAGRMPGHMNVLLAEAEVPYDRVLPLEEINQDFPQTDVVLVVGANDIVNPDALDLPSSPIYGMPILETHKAKLVYCIKRSLRAGYAGVENPLYFADNCNMIFGDAKAVIEDLVNALK